MPKALKNILKGMGSVLDMFGTRPYRIYPHRSEADALRSDWERVGKDISRARREFGDKLSKANK